MFPLLIPLSATTDKITKTIVSTGQSASSALSDVGIGIASIFILFVVFYYVSAILDGGRFQAKMLWPLVIYVMVCNFGVVGSLAVDFTSRIQEKSIAACQRFESDRIGDRTLFEYMWEMYSGGVDEGVKALEEEIKKMQEDQAMDEPPGDDSTEAEKNTWLGKQMAKIGGSISSEVKKWWTDFRVHAYESLAMTSTMRSYSPGVLIVCYGAPMLVVFILDWIIGIIRSVICLMASVSVAVFVAFGPITWAFAVFPGNGRVIGSWFIRLVQFSLYGPIVALISAFSATIAGEIASALGYSVATMSVGFSTLSLIVCQVAVIALLTQVPALASMIVEGAQGGISHLDGIQKIANATEPMRDRSMERIMTSRNNVSSSTNTPPPPGGGGTGGGGSIPPSGGGGAGVASGQATSAGGGAAAAGGAATAAAPPVAVAAAVAGGAKKVAGAVSNAQKGSVQGSAGQGGGGGKKG